MKIFIDLIKKFNKDQSGAFLVIFAVIGVVLIATSGATVDFVRIDSARNKAQFALDASVLALQSDIYTKSETLLTAEAQSLLDERMRQGGRATATIVQTDVDINEGDLYFRADVTVPMAFTRLVGIETMTTSIVSEATRKALNLEVAFVLDNSGSMASANRMTHLKTAAVCATNVLFYGACNPPVGATKNPKVKVSIVPFTFTVNVGAGYKNASWVDGAGASSIANDNFDDDDDDSNTFTGNVDRLALYDGMVNEPWRGCFDSRPYPHSVRDTLPISGNPDTLFTPSFAPDEPDSGPYFNDYIDDTPNQCPQLATGACTCEKWSKHWYQGGKLCTSYDTGGNVVATGVNACSCNSHHHYIGHNSSKGHRHFYSCPGQSLNLSDREKQERICKYSGANPSYYGNRGPNAECGYVALLPLTSTPSTAIARINSMYADGGTNIQNGAVWGFHALSPTEPLAEGLNYGSATSKVMIIMTDGSNYYPTYGNMNGTSYYQTTGYLYNNRIGSIGDSQNTVQAHMDTLTVETCNNAKAAGIEVFSIGLSASASNKTMLTACASKVANAYFPTSPSELESVFQDIAEQLADLRLSL